MFRLRNPDVVIPQREHARLAGLIAAQWGNAAFDRPSMDHAAFVAGVTLHDWHYADADTFPLDDLDDGLGDPARQAEWIEIMRRGCDPVTADPVADCVAAHHVRRLLAREESAVAADLRARLDERISRRIDESAPVAADYQWADRITALCDLTAFDLFREGVREREVRVHPRRGSAVEITMRVTTTLAAQARLDPWPLAVDEMIVPMVAFERAGYPSRLAPRVVLVRVARATD